MLCTRMAWSCLGALAVATWLATSHAQAQDDYHMVGSGSSSDNGEELTEVHSDISELRSNMKASVSSPYEQGPSCGCGAQMGPSCGCETSCGCEASCGCDSGCGGCDSCSGTWGGFEPCCHPCGLYAIGELLFFRYHRTDGVRVGDGAPGEDEEFNFDPTTRFTVGYVRNDGLGVRARWWQYDHNANKLGEDDAFLDVKTYNIDLEVFDTFALNCKWDLELSAGVRYNWFREQQVDEGADDFRENRFHAYGGIIAAEARRCVGTSGTIWARARASVLMGDKFVFNEDGGVVTNDVRLLDTVTGQFELAFGYDYIVPVCDGSYYFARVSAEFQQWSNFSSSFTEVDRGGGVAVIGERSFGGASDVGFGGFGFAVGLVR